MPQTQIDILWEGPFKIGWDRDSELYIPVLPGRLPDEIGIYQIYGKHPLYGDNVLLYIGETTTRKAISGFHARLLEHVKGRFWYFANLSVHVGLVTKGAREVPVKDMETIQAVESMLIATHKPALNTQHINRPNSNAKNYHLYNWGDYGSLFPETSARWHFWNESAP
jgi:hypothetical protein